MIYKSEDAEKRSAFLVADKMVAAAKTAPRAAEKTRSYLLF